MTPLAVFFMLFSVTAVVSLAGWCYYRVLFGDSHTPEQPDKPTLVEESDVR